MVQFQEDVQILIKLKKGFSPIALDEGLLKVIN